MDRARLFLDVHCERQRGSGHKMQEGKILLGVRKNCFVMEVVK